jgi:ABC-type glycerol-3-phosphate transport system substrate-binding protein
MKRGLVIIAVVMLVLSLYASGCGEDPAKTSTTGSSGSVTSDTSATTTSTVASTGSASPFDEPTLNPST